MRWLGLKDTRVLVRNVDLLNKTVFVCCLLLIVKFHRLALNGRTEQGLGLLLVGDERCCWGG